MITMGVEVQVVLLAALLGLVAGGKHDIYAGYSVHGVTIRDQADVTLLQTLQSDFYLDIWQYGTPGHRDALLMVAPEHTEAFLDKLDEHNLEHYLSLRDIPKALDEFDDGLARYKRRRTGQAVPFDDYPRYAEVNEYLERIAAQYPDIATVETAGSSFEGRDVKYLKISTTNFTDSSKPIYFMNAMLHAREWVTTPVTLYTIHRLVEDLREEDRDLLEGTDWIIMPLVNPDGYEYSHTNVRLWRKTRSINLNVSETCIGVDANRNFDFAFNTLGVSSDPCEIIYPGHMPFSEPETGYVRDVLMEHLPRIQLNLDIHSHGNWVLFGFGNRTVPSNGLALHHVGAVMGAQIDAVKLPEARYYTVGNSAMLLYPTSGSQQDYAQSIGIPFSYTLELPAYGRDFRVPPEYIAQINMETWRGIAAQARLSKLHYNARYGI